MPDEVRADPADLIHAAEDFRQQGWAYVHSYYTPKPYPWITLTASGDPAYSLQNVRETLDEALTAMDLIGKTFHQTSIALYHTAFAYYEADQRAAAELDQTTPLDGPL